MLKVTGSFAIGIPANICRNDGTLSSELNWTIAVIFVRTKAERIRDRNTREALDLNDDEVFRVVAFCLSG
jgi:hypothetical protein